MYFKIDENLPSETCELLNEAGHDAVSVLDQRLGGKPDSEIASVCQSEARAIVTLDSHFANIVAYPPRDFSGIIVIRTDDQSKPTVLALVRQFILALSSESPRQHLWIVERKQIRIRGSE